MRKLAFNMLEKIFIKNYIYYVLFKIHEILKDYSINNLEYCSCIAEGPGGFINCLLNNYDIKCIYCIEHIEISNFMCLTTILKF